MEVSDKSFVKLMCFEYINVTGNILYARNEMSCSLTAQRNRIIMYNRPREEEPYEHGFWIVSKAINETGHDK